MENGIEPFVTAYDDLIDAADQARSMNFRSVTKNDGDHDFTNEESDKDAAEAMSTAARDCGLAYWFTGNDAYAERCIDIIHHFCLSDDTYTTPTMNIEGKHLTIGANIMQPGLWYGASFVRGHSRWDHYDGSRPWDGGNSGDAESAFKQWVRDRLDTFDSTNTSHVNNIWAWRVADYATSAAYLEDDSEMQTAKELWQANGHNQYPDGSDTNRPWVDFVNVISDEYTYDGSADEPHDHALFYDERNRSNGFHYTHFNLEAMTICLLVFEAYDGTDLWGFNAPTDNFSGSSMLKAFDWFQDWVEDPNAWKWNDSESVPSSEVEDAAGVYEMAHYHWGTFGNVVDEGDGRPHELRWYAGPLSLTHGAEV